MNWFTATDPSTPYNEQDFSGQWVTAGPYFISAHDIGRSLVLERNKNYTGSAPHNADRIVVSRWAWTRTRASCRSRRPGRSRRRSRRRCRRLARRRSTASTRSSSWSSRRVVTTWWALNTLPGTPVRERQPPQGGQLGDRPAGAGSRLRQVRWSPHRPDPSAGDAGLHPERQPLRLSRARTSPRRRPSPATSPTSP